MFTLHASGPVPSYNIGFVSTRFAGTDGVSLETAKWAEVLAGLGHKSFYFAGLCDRPAEVSMVVPEAFYRHPEVLARHERFFGSETRSREDTLWVHTLRDKFVEDLYRFIETFSIDLLVPENCMTIPLNIPLGLALTEVIAETGIPVIAHHHDFVWERKRFLINGVNDYIDKAFPPGLPSIQHVVINSIAQADLASKCAVSSTIIPNVMNFEQCEVFLDGYAGDLRSRLGLSADDIMVLQPTRIIQRKGIEHAIELVSRLGSNATLVISHASGDEGDAYAKRVRDYAELLKVRTIFAEHLVGEHRGSNAQGEKLYSLADMYHQADLVTYPSAYEGFGNAFLEGVFYHKPMVVQNYTVYTADIRPKGFRAVEFDEYVTDATVAQVREVLADKAARTEMCERNFELARKYFSYPTLRYKLATLIANAFGPEEQSDIEPAATE
ncbi:MAG: glycosyltransferase family 4 protein [Bdellovibrionales bacterium]|nr:glycosyltransferase family 4 protein [Bdellovibrionales bacterium]